MRVVARWRGEVLNLGTGHVGLLILVQIHVDRVVNGLPLDLLEDFLASLNIAAHRKLLIDQLVQLSTGIAGVVDGA